MQLCDQTLAIARHLPTDVVLRVERLALEEQLGHSSIDMSTDIEMQVRRQHASPLARIRPGLDRREPEAALSIGELFSVSLEIGIQWAGFGSEG
jgi:hypothetical protein